MAGFCPMGCGQTLQLVGYTVTCRAGGCPRPAAAAEILAEAETEHVVELGEHQFSVLHPLRERLDTALLVCPLADWVGRQAPADLPRGRFRARLLAEGIVSWEPLMGAV